MCWSCWTASCVIAYQGLIRYRIPSLSSYYQASSSASKICKSQKCIYVYANVHIHIYAKNMQKYAKLNMLKYSFLKYHNMLNLCLDMHYMPKISINMHKYAKKNVQICKKIWKYMHLPNEFTPIAYICTYMKKNVHLYAKYVSMKFICIICTSSLS